MLWEFQLTGFGETELSNVCRERKEEKKMRKREERKEKEEKRGRKKRRKERKGGWGEEDKGR